MPNEPTDLQLTNELSFLITCCQSEPSQEDISRILSYLEKDTPNVERLLRLAGLQGILPLVYKTLKNLPLENHDDLLQQFKSAYTQIAQRNMLMTAELIRIMKLLEDNGIEALAFKGPTLSQLAYGDITMRQFGDLDIYVKEENIYQVAQLLVEQNYEPMDSIGFLKNPAKLNVEKNYEFYEINKKIKIEIHWKLINTYFLKKFNNLDLFTTQNIATMNKRIIPTLNTKTLLIYLCNHGASHMWERFEWIVDITQLIKTAENSLNWNEILKLASTLQSETTLLLGLGLSKKFFHTNLPPEITLHLESKQLASLVNLVTHNFNSDLITQDHTSHKKNFKVFQFNLTLQNSLFGKISFILHTLFDYSDRDIMIINLPKSLFFLYYPIRIVRIINKYTLRPVTKYIHKKLN